ncbi:PREDICTED: uncharacterized protein LOC106818325 [Priapulus caudatus]|uniref:Uncharacterized protein LOC106818325 n=1 Tax=Priapulus caudatus TaxID=37621 RepID=A0ABM1F256_PRICU|nr:PREDICTED: uncharacterized protein LOC106818325 [Priapulus caudatus]
MGGDRRKLNAIGTGSSRTVGLAELKTLWKNLQMKAKKANGFQKREAVKTGGVPSPPPLDETTNIIIGFMNDKPSFSGIPGGIETGPASDTRVSMWGTHVKVTFNDEELRQRYRFGKKGIAFLYDTVKDDLQRPTKHSCAIPAIVQVLIAIRLERNWGYFRSFKSDRIERSRM